MDPAAVFIERGHFADFGVTMARGVQHLDFSGDADAHFETKIR